MEQIAFEKWFAESGWDDEYKCIAESGWNAAVKAAVGECEGSYAYIEDIDDLYA